MHIVDQLYTPFGLVRNGIAPDHPEAKNVINDFTTNVLQHKNAKFIGGVHVNEAGAEGQQQEDDDRQNRRHHKQTVSIKDLYQHYHAVVVATGATAGKNLNIPNEHSHGVYDSREFVSWYVL